MSAEPDRDPRIDASEEQEPTPTEGARAEPRHEPPPAPSEPRFICRNSHSPPWFD